MLLKYWYTALVLLTFLFISCDNDQNESDSPSPLYPVGREFNVNLNIAPFLEVDEQPLARSLSTLPKGLYAVNVFWKGKGLTSFQPYASGLFNGPYGVSIGLIEGYTYRFDCGFLASDEVPYSQRENGKILYGLPFSRSFKKEVDGFVTNRLLVSINPLNTNESFYQHIYKGEMQMKEDSTSTHPTVKRFFGSQLLDFLNPAANTSVTLTLKRAYYSVQFATDELNPGDSIKIEATDISPFYLVHSAGGKAESEERIISMYNISGYYTGKLEEEETVAFTISYRPADEEEWYPLYTNQGIKLKRNKKNTIKIVKINDHISDAGFNFEEDSEMEETIQEIGK